MIRNTSEEIIGEPTRCAFANRAPFSASLIPFFCLILDHWDLGELAVYYKEERALYCVQRGLYRSWTGIASILWPRGLQ